jgi:hypothetical protein
MRATRAYVRRVCHDALQRAPSPDEATALLALPDAQIARHLLGTEEAMRMWLEEELQYSLLLDNFRPRTPAVEGLPEALRKGRATVHAATAELLLSPAFSLRNPGNDTFVTVVLEQCLGMTVQDRRNAAVLEAGKQCYDGKRTTFLGEIGGSQADVVRIVLRQRGFTKHLLDRHHRRLFLAPLPEKDSATVDRLHADHTAFFPILAEWLASERYLALVPKPRVRSERQFVRSLYIDLLGREPTRDELRNMRNALQAMADATPLRAVMAKVILDSGKARLPELQRGAESAFVTACFQRYLGREPGPEELTAFLAVLEDADATAAHVVRALLASPEYQLY